MQKLYVRSSLLFIGLLFSSLPAYCMPPTLILIYTGKGVDATCADATRQWLDTYTDTPVESHVTIETLEEASQKARATGEHLLVVIPGGSAYTIAGAMRLYERETTRKLPLFEDIQHNHISYLGICAGGYLFCEQYEITLTHRTTGRTIFTDVGHFAVIPGLTHAPFDSFRTADCAGAKAAELMLEGAPDVGYCLWNGGPAFNVSPDLEWKRLASYASGHGDAVITKRYSSGSRMVLSGVHPEFAEREIDILKGAKFPVSEADRLRAQNCNDLLSRRILEELEVSLREPWLDPSNL